MAANTAKTETNKVTIELSAMEVVIIKEALNALQMKRNELSTKATDRGNKKLAVGYKRTSDHAATIRKNLPDTFGNSLEYAFFSTPTSWGGVKP
jgi:hypothetical protein